jgi:hypothetical protein
MNLFEKLMFAAYAAADDKVSECATVNTNGAAAIILRGLAGATTKFRNLVANIQFPFNDSVSGPKSVDVIYTRTTPLADADYAGLPVGSICVQLPVSSAGAVTSAIYWVKEDTTAAGWRQFAGPDSVSCATVTLTSAQVKALKATPITLVAAPGADLAIVPVSINLVANYGGTNAFTEDADDLSIGYSGGAEIKEIESTGFIDQTNDEWRYITFEHAETFIPEENTAVVITNLDDEIAGNAGADNTVEVKLWYRVVPTDL